MDSFVVGGGGGGCGGCFFFFFFFFQAEDGIRDDLVTGVQTCALPISVIFCRFSPARVLSTTRA